MSPGVRAAQVRPSDTPTSDSCQNTARFRSASITTGVDLDASAAPGAPVYVGPHSARESAGNILWLTARAGSKSELPLTTGPCESWYRLVVS